MDESQCVSLNDQCTSPNVGHGFQLCFNTWTNQSYMLSGCELPQHPHLCELAVVATVVDRYKGSICASLQETDTYLERTIVFAHLYHVDCDSENPCHCHLLCIIFMAEVQRL
jgi:hypothetical protein